MAKIQERRPLTGDRLDKLQAHRLTLASVEDLTRKADKALCDFARTGRHADAVDASDALHALSGKVAVLSMAFDRFAADGR